MTDEAAAPAEAAPAPEVSQNAGVSIGMPNTTPTVEAAPTEFSNIIPADFADKPWVKDVKDIPGLFKMTDDLKSKMGERPAGIPHENSTPEERAAFNKSFGVPEAAADYKLSDPIKGHEDFQNRVRDIMLKNNLSQGQAEGLDADWNELMESLSPDPEAQNADFDKMATDIFGDNKDKVLSDANALLEAHSKDLPDDTKAAFNNLPNNILVPLAAVLNSIQGKYINEDDIPTGATVPSGMSPEERRAKGATLMASPAWKDSFHPDHAKVAAEVKAIYGT